LARLSEDPLDYYNYNIYNFNMITPERHNALSLRPSLPLDAPIEESLRQLKVPVAMRRLRLLIDSLGVSSERLREVLSALGDLVVGSPYLHPRILNQAQFAQWLGGRNKMPTWRLAQCVAVLEAILVEQRAEGEKILEPDDPKFALWEADARNIAAFERDEELRNYLDRFRVTFRRLLKEEAGKGPTEAIRYDRYARHLHSLGIGKKAGERADKEALGVTQYK
jgi:hypothetical protein